MGEFAGDEGHDPALVCFFAGPDVTCRGEPFMACTFLVESPLSNFHVDGSFEFRLLRTSFAFAAKLSEHSVSCTSTWGAEHTASPAPARGGLSTASPALKITSALYHAHKYTYVHAQQAELSCPPWLPTLLSPASRSPAGSPYSTSGSCCYPQCCPLADGSTARQRG